MKIEFRLQLLKYTATCQMVSSSSTNLPQVWSVYSKISIRQTLRCQNVSDKNMAKVQKCVQEETDDVILSVQNSANTSNSSALTLSLVYYSDRQHNQCVYVSGL